MLQCLVERHACDYVSDVPEPIEIVSYEPRWKVRFAELEVQLRGELGSLATGVEHVGSTAVPGLCAKPIVDIDVVVGPDSDFAAVTEVLARLGYEHKGDLGVEGRESFQLTTAATGERDHHLYVCREDAKELQRHIEFRDRLRAESVLAAEYGKLKQALASRFRNDREAYTVAKTEFIEGVLREGRTAPQQSVPSNRSQRAGCRGPDTE